MDSSTPGLVKTSPSFASLPPELRLFISKNLPLRDRLSLADACSTCRSLVSDEQCTKACTFVGLKASSEASPRAMAKLLCRPRIGVCNWSLEGGTMKYDLDFSQVHLTSTLIAQAKEVHLHPSFMPPHYPYIHELTALDKVRIRIAKDSPPVLLCKNRLYMHEYATCPPVDELRVYIQSEYRPLRRDDVTFRIRNPTGVTLANYHEGLAKFLTQIPDPRMRLTSSLLKSYSTNNGAKKAFEEKGRTNLAMLDVWYTLQRTEFPFSEMCLGANPLRGGALELRLTVEDPSNCLGPAVTVFLDEQCLWGHPFTECDEDEQGYPVERAMPSGNDKRKAFWEEHAPVVIGF